MAFLMIFNIDLGALSTQGKLATYMMAIYTSLCLKTIVYWATQKNISLTWNTDGVPLFKSSSFALWPLYFIVNELPYNKRIQRENMIFAGFCFGTNKLFFSPFYDGLSKLEAEGINITIPGETACSFNSKVIVICGTCDLPAKCMVCNTIQYNGFYGCCKCKNKKHLQEDTCMLFHLMQMISRGRKGHQLVLWKMLNKPSIAGNP